MDRALDQLASAGIDIQGAPEFGRLVRCKTEGDKGSKRSGWYVLHEMRLDNGETVVVGRYGNWKLFGDEVLKIEFDAPSLSPEERQRFAAEQEKIREKAAKEKRERAEQAASRALRIWQKLPVEGPSEYLQKKKVAAFGARFSRGSIVLRVVNGTGLVGLQFISPDGNKKFLTGTPIQGAWCPLTDLTTLPKRLWIAEGYATAATAAMATTMVDDESQDEGVVCAFSAGNLIHVARAFRAMPGGADIELVIVSDNDRYTNHPKTGEPWNPGIEFATAAATATGARLAVPDFTRTVEEGGTDFNDLYVLHGMTITREQLLAGASLPGPIAEEGSSSDQPPAPPNTPPTPSAEVVQLPVLNLERALARFAIAMPDGKIWDIDKKQLLKKTAARDMMGKALFDEWVNHSEKRQVDQSVVRLQAATAAEKGGGGLYRALKRFVYLYPTADAWDREKRMRVPLSALRHAIADSFDDWIKSDRRAEVDVEKLVFDPRQLADPKTHINTFRGLPLSPSPDDSKCEGICRLLAHLCNGDAEIINYLYQWLAYPLQHVGAKMGSAVLMHSSMQGSGKSLFFEKVIKPLYGEYASTVSQTQLESQYTDWRSQLLFGLFEEVLSRDQKYSHTGTLKHMITGETMRVEKKFISGWEEANHMNSVFLSNELQPFPLEPSDRRFLVVWPETKMPADLKALVLSEIENGGVEAFYSVLKRFSTNGFTTHTEPPITEAKARLIDFGRPAWEVFLMDWQAGALEDSFGVPYMPCLVDQLFGVYRRWCDRRRENVVSQTKFSAFLSAQDGLTRRRDVRYSLGQVERKGVFLVPKMPREDYRQMEGETDKVWLGRCKSKFDLCVKPSDE